MQKSVSLIYRKQISEHGALLHPHQPSKAGLPLRVVQAALLSCNLLGRLVSVTLTVMLLSQAISLQTVSAAALSLRVHPQLLGRGLLQDTDHAGGTSTFCIRGICFL